MSLRGFSVIFVGGVSYTSTVSCWQKAQQLSQQGADVATTMTTCPDGHITIINRIISQPLTVSAATPAKPQPLEKFYRGEPLALGITQILVGAVLFAVGMVTSLADLYFWRLEMSVYIPIWSGLLYVVSGALSVAAAKNPKIPLVKGTLGMNIISSLVAGCALILYLITLMEFNYYVCDLNPEHCRVYKLIRSCTLVLLLFTFLEFCISISIAAFGCKTVCWNSYSEVTVVIYQNMMPADNPTSATNAHTDGVACTPAPYKDLTP